jgi:hypothetical protein
MNEDVFAAEVIANGFMNFSTIRFPATPAGMLRGSFEVGSSGSGLSGSSALVSLLNVIR